MTRAPLSFPARLVILNGTYEFRSRPHICGGRAPRSPRENFILVYFSEDCKDSCHGPNHMEGNLKRLAVIDVFQKSEQGIADIIH